MGKITPFLWFDNNAEDAIAWYSSIFDDVIVHSEKRVSDEHGKQGALYLAEISIAGQNFTLMNGGPYFHFTEAVSFYVRCDSQAEVDKYWNKLAEGGEEQQCGWLKDKFGLSWQIVPTAFETMMRAGTPEQQQRVTEAMLKMKKMNIAEFEIAYNK